MARKKKNSPKQKNYYQDNSPKAYVVLYKVDTVDGPDSAFQGVYRTEGMAKAEAERTRKEFKFEDDEVWVLSVPFK